MGSPEVLCIENPRAYVLVRHIILQNDGLLVIYFQSASINNDGRRLERMRLETLIELHNPHNNLNQYTNDLVKIVFLCLKFSLDMTRLCQCMAGSYTLYIILF